VTDKKNVEDTFSKGNRRFHVGEIEVCNIIPSNSLRPPEPVTSPGAECAFSSPSTVS
jgi:hypothetical protein